MKKYISILILPVMFILSSGCSGIRQSEPSSAAETSAAAKAYSETYSGQSSVFTEPESTLPASGTETLTTAAAVRETTSVTETETETETVPETHGFIRRGIDRLFGYTQSVTQQAEQTEESGSVENGEKPTNEDGSRDYSYFDDSAFVGNSRIVNFGTFGYAKNVYASVGLTVETVFTEKLNGTTVINKLTGKSFRKVYLYFGDNECGWPSMAKFQEQYKKVIDAVRTRCPGAEIYLISVMPISRSASAKGENGYTISAIKNVNKYIEELASSEGIHYINSYGSVSNASGYLPDEAASDGVHMKKDYIERWAAYMYDNT